jgi:hypothetical protein
MPQPSPPSPPSPPHAYGSPLDLDARYPSEVEFWADLDAGGRPRRPAHWLGHRIHMPIPHRIHQTWKDEHPPRKLFSPRWARSLRERNPGWQYTLWTDAQNRELVRTHYPELLRMYDGYGSAIQRADVARYLIANTYGGVYADLDTECFKPFVPLTAGSTPPAGEGPATAAAARPRPPSLLLSYKAGGNFSRGACNSIFASSARHPFWRVVIDVLVNRSMTALDSGHTAVLFSTGPSVLREAIRRLLRLPDEMSITEPALELLRAHLGIAVLHARWLHPVTADRRTEDDEAARGADAVCTHHFVSSWVAHDPQLHARTEQRRARGDGIAAMHGPGQHVLRENAWSDGSSARGGSLGRGASSHGGSHAAAAAGVQFVVTGSMRRQLAELGYTPEDADALQPERARVIVDKHLRKPRSGVPARWKRAPGA